MSISESVDYVVCFENHSFAQIEFICQLVFSLMVFSLSFDFGAQF